MKTRKSTSSQNQSSSQRPRLLVLHGPNLNLLGTREPNHYGQTTLADINLALAERAATANVDLESFQSNHEGALIERVHAAREQGVRFIIINPAAYTHTSVAILDALKAVAIPAVEVHISAVETREDFRQVSYARLACFATITGEGLQGYAHALELLKEYLEK